MKKLPSNWLTKGTLDFEYKKYILLAYLKKVHKNFHQHRLYPFLTDLMEHYHNLIGIKKNKKEFYDNFPEHISKVDLQNLIIEYEKVIEDDSYMEEVESIIDFAVPKIRKQVEEGQELYDFVQEHLSIFPVGLVSLYKEEGYLFLHYGGKRAMKVFEYRATIYEKAQEKYRTIRTNFVSDYRKSITNTYESIKQDLVDTYERFANPATYVIETEMTFPLQETLLPVAKRKLARYLAA